MESYRHILKTPLLGRYEVPWDLALPLSFLMGGFLFGANLLFLLFLLLLSMTALFWVRRSGEGTIRGWIAYALREKVHRVE